MKLVFPHRSYLDKILLFALLLFAFLIPLNKKNIPLLIVVWIILWLFRGSFKEKARELKKNRIFFLLLIFYLLHIIGMLYTTYVSEGLFDLEVKLSLLLFPVVIFSDREFFARNKNYIFSAFVLGNVAGAVICLLNSAFNAPKDVFFYFQYADFSLFHHPSYASMYALFSICILLYFLDKNPFARLSYHKLIYLALILILLAYIFFLSSRTGTIAAILALGFWGMYTLYIKRKWLLLALTVIAFIALPVAVVSFHPRFIPVMRFLKTPADSLDMASGENVTIRYAVLLHSTDIIEENFFSGTGTGDVKASLVEMYKEKNITAALEQKLNAHNQYIETFIGLGIGGILSLFLLIFMPVFRGIRNRDILPVMFSLIIMINFFSESMLNTQAGVIFFAFFNTLLSLNLFAGKDSGNQQAVQRFL